MIENDDEVEDDDEVPVRRAVLLGVVTTLPAPRAGVET